MNKIQHTRTHRHTHRKREAQRQKEIERQTQPKGLWVAWNGGVCSWTVELRHHLTCGALWWSFLSNLFVHLENVKVRCVPTPVGRVHVALRLSILTANFYNMVFEAKPQHYGDWRRRSHAHVMGCARRLLWPTKHRRPDDDGEPQCYSHFVALELHFSASTVHLHGLWCPSGSRHLICGKSSSRFP